MTDPIHPDEGATLSKPAGPIRYLVNAVVALCLLLIFFFILTFFGVPKIGDDLGNDDSERRIKAVTEANSIQLNLAENYAVNPDTQQVTSIPVDRAMELVVREAQESDGRTIIPLPSGSN